MEDESVDVDADELDSFDDELESLDEDEPSDPPELLDESDDAPGGVLA